MVEETRGKIILLNGASSAGKSTLAQAVQGVIEEPFLQFSLDFFFFSDRVLPRRRDRTGPFAWKEMRPHVFEGYFRCLAALLSAGNNLVVDIIIETTEQYDRLVELLAPFDVFLVGVHCSLAELERRERLRGDRPVGDAARDLLTVHSFTPYDFEVDSVEPADQNAERIVAAWTNRASASVPGKNSFPGDGC